MGLHQQETAQSDVFSYMVKVAQQASLLVDNLPLKKSFIDGFLVHIHVDNDGSDAYTWPPLFIEMWERERRQSKYATATFRKRFDRRLSQLSETDIIYYGWCNHILDKHNATNALITSTLNKLWVPSSKLRSGTNVTSLHQSIRKFWYDQWCIIVGSHYVINQKSVRKKKGLPVMTDQEVMKLRLRDAAEWLRF